jgi:hypothetical protein
VVVGKGKTVIISKDATPLEFKIGDPTVKDNAGALDVLVRRAPAR